MHKNDVKFKEFNKSIEKMQYKSGKSFSEDYLKQHKTFIEMLQFVSGLLVLTLALFLIMTSTFSDINIKYIFSAITVLFPILIGISMIFFMKRKIFGLVIFTLGCIGFLLTLLCGQTDFTILKKYLFILICNFIYSIGMLLIVILKPKSK